MHEDNCTMWYNFNKLEERNSSWLQGTGVMADGNDGMAELRSRLVRCERKGVAIFDMNATALHSAGTGRRPPQLGYSVLDRLIRSYPMTTIRGSAGYYDNAARVETSPHKVMLAAGPSASPAVPCPVWEVTELMWLRLGANQMGMEHRAVCLPWRVQTTGWAAEARVSTLDGVDRGVTAGSGAIVETGDNVLYPHVGDFLSGTCNSPASSVVGYGEPKGASVQTSIRDGIFSVPADFHMSSVKRRCNISCSPNAMLDVPSNRAHSLLRARSQAPEMLITEGMS